MNEVAYEGEKVFHSNPSGIDNTVSTFGGAVIFKKGESPVSIEGKIPMKVIIIDTGVPRRTKEAVESVKRLLDEHPSEIQEAFSQMDKIATDAFSVLKNPCLETHKSLEVLVENNQKLLAETLHVSHPSLDKAIDLCHQNGLCAKLTGAGCGGSAFAFVPPQMKDDSISILQKALNDIGMSSFVTSLCSDGVSLSF